MYCQDEEQREGRDANAGGAAIQQHSRSVKGNGRRGKRDGKRGGLKAVITSRITYFSKAACHKKNVTLTDPANYSVFHGGGFKEIRGW